MLKSRNDFIWDVGLLLINETSLCLSNIFFHEKKNKTNIAFFFVTNDICLYTYPVHEEEARHVAD